MKRFTVKVIPNARQNSVEQSEEALKVRVMAPATDGKANKAVVKILSDFFGVRKSAIEIVKGEKSREKIVEINL